MKAISIRQPWAWAVIYGGKDIENRSGRAIVQMQSAIGQRVYVHASKSTPRWQFDEAAAFMRSIGVECPDPDSLDYGGVIGTVMVKDAVYVNDDGQTMLAGADVVWRGSPWFNGDAGFLLEDPRPVRFFEVKGRLGLFDVKRR